MRLADPLPGFCSVCYAASPERRFIDCEAEHDGAPVLDRETGTIAILPWDGQLASHDSLYVCEACWKEGTELLGQKAELHGRQFQEIRRLEITNEHLRAVNRRTQEALDGALEALQALGEPAPKRRRKVAA